MAVVVWAVLERVRPGGAHNSAHCIYGALRCGFMACCSGWLSEMARCLIRKVHERTGYRNTFCQVFELGMWDGQRWRAQSRSRAISVRELIRRRSVARIDYEFNLDWIPGTGRLSNRLVVQYSTKTRRREYGWESGREGGGCHSGKVKTVTIQGR